ncbi:MAG TPA: RNA 2',3'-cyclic phosphodiesterase [Pyrinomonadaceae bacterium]|nr:RNA 2',3'-cyclic phosphodiesterase [Pyrinomonadaceae bacterium]
MPQISQTHWRVFCAIDLPGEVKSRVAAHIASLRARFPKVRASWERPEKLHLTLKFLGDVEISRVEEFSRAAEGAASSFEPFKLAVAEAGAFPPHGSPRVLWLGIEDAAGRLSGLQRSLEDVCHVAGFEREGRPFKPHLTVARIRTPHGARELADAHRETSFEPQTFIVSELVIIRSEMGPGGSRYTPVSRHPFLRM